MNSCRVFLIVFLLLVQIVNAKTTGLVCAVPCEMGNVLELMENPIMQELGGRKYYRGLLYGQDTVLVAAKIGKVAAAITAVNLIIEFMVDQIVFIGVAGALDTQLNVGDIVIANSLVQHDMDARPFCERFAIPLLHIKECYSDPLLVQFALNSSKVFLENDFENCISENCKSEFFIANPKVVIGQIVTGDQVISKDADKLRLKELLPKSLCVEMEGAGIAQVCYEYKIPFVVIRTISDYANRQHISADVKKFIQEIAGVYSEGIIKNLYGQFNEPKIAFATLSPDSQAASIVPGASNKIEACSPAK